MLDGSPSSHFYTEVLIPSISDVAMEKGPYGVLQPGTLGTPARRENVDTGAQPSRQWVDTGRAVVPCTERGLRGGWPRQHQPLDFQLAESRGKCIPVA